MKAKFTTHGNDAITVEYIDPVTDLPCTRTFVRRQWYIYELVSTLGEIVVCKRLCHYGEVLTVTQETDMLELIRHQYMKMKHASIQHLKV